MTRLLCVAFRTAKGRERGPARTNTEALDSSCRHCRQTFAFFCGSKRRLYAIHLSIGVAGRLIFQSREQPTIWLLRRTPFERHGASRPVNEDRPAWLTGRLAPCRYKWKQPVCPSASPDGGRWSVHRCPLMYDLKATSSVRSGRNSPCLLEDWCMTKPQQFGFTAQ